MKIDIIYFSTTIFSNNCFFFFDCVMLVFCMYNFVLFGLIQILAFFLSRNTWQRWYYVFQESANWYKGVLYSYYCNDYINGWFILYYIG